MHESRFQALYLSARARLWAYVYRITGERDLTDDLLQESFCRIYQIPDDQLAEGAERAYLFRVATNLANDHFRRNSRLRRHLSALLGAPTTSDDPRAAHEMQALFQRLRPRDRALLWLAHVEGYSHAEIAEILALKPASIRVLLSRARKRLSALIQGRAPEDTRPRGASPRLGASLSLEGPEGLSFEALENINPGRSP